MQIGKIPDIDNAKENVIQKNQKLSETKEESKLIDKDEYKKALSTNVANKSEVIIDNITFGYNKESKDFFVKVTRGDVELKFPTEDMMRLKAYLLEELEKNNSI
ncbi:hypothetical protein [Aliarcobacter cibarius]|jgi:uncharacterized FlaG/YvyC family protein|uniref:FlaG family protein n=1 Tax=Aliarcobacter cibarius TaxID=255507 RepID=A0A5J6REN8_9BACT|nr:hypothetical protein [Aliarcobacter cibarius]QEZ88550.1 FlaG family protein [Aliarcobacter cibarius]QKJ26589.1 FlaG family protein [Aliarcobacter cibarius]TLS98944.1 flagellin [Aliarcobacter cibarius]TLS99860.1 flagellin [Aliarcobacter cibarius]TLT03767.1 flagellin [Aliarcobacter cibarius]